MSGTCSPPHIIWLESNKVFLTFSQFYSTIRHMRLLDLHFVVILWFLKTIKTSNHTFIGVERWASIYVFELQRQTLTFFHEIFQLLQGFKNVPSIPNSDYKNSRYTKPRNDYIKWKSIFGNSLSIKEEICNRQQENVCHDSEKHKISPIQWITLWWFLSRINAHRFEK